MPGQLRRQWSECSNSSVDTTLSWPFGDCATPQCVSPPKRRRLVIQGVVSSPASPIDKVGYQVTSRSKSLWSTEEVAHKTPSRADGLSEREEGIGRLSACDLTRQIVRELLGRGDANLDEARLRAQVLACYCVQVFFMYASLQKENTDALSAAAALMALKAVGSPYQVDDVLQVQGALCPASVSDASSSREQILKIESRLLLLVPGLRGTVVRFLGPVASLTDRLVRRLPENEAFVASCGSRPPAAVARELEPQLAQVARCFLADAMQGLAPLLVEPHAVAAAALLLASSYELRRTGHAVGEDKLFGLVYEAGQGEGEGASPWSDGSPVPAPEPPIRADLKQAVKEIMKVFKLVHTMKSNRLVAA